MSNQPESNQPGNDTSWRCFSIALLHEIGLKHKPRCYRNYRFILAMLAGALFLLLFHDLIPAFSSSFQFNWAVFLSLVIWQPLIEEVLFRGIIQGQFAKREWGKHSWLNISSANLATSVLFVIMHMVNSSPLFALTVFVPSLVFGYLRDYCNSVYPCIILHGAYNAMVFAGLILNHSMEFPLL
jgi:membrane protease YdiL (CAAX protease family)